MKTVAHCNNILFLCKRLSKEHNYNINNKNVAARQIVYKTAQQIDLTDLLQYYNVCNTIGISKELGSGLNIGQGIIFVEIGRRSDTITFDI